jgi:protein MAK16
VSDLEDESDIEDIEDQFEWEEEKEQDNVALTN